MDTSTYVTRIIGIRYDFLMNVLVYSNYSHVIIIRIWHQLCRALDHEWIHPWREVIVGLKLSPILLQRRHHPTLLLPLPLNSKYNNLCIFLLFLHCICIRQQFYYALGIHPDDTFLTSLTLTLFLALL